MRLSLSGVLIALAVLAVTATAIEIVARPFGHTASSPAGPSPSSQPALVTNQQDPLAADVINQQNTVKVTPQNYSAWASLGLDYVQQAKITVNPAYYPKAEAVLKQSLTLNSTENYLAMAGEAALKAAEHDFAGALVWAQKGLKINPYNASLYGALNDAETQLGRYPQAFAAAQKMNDLQPGVAAFTRAEYVFELQGKIANAKAAMNLALTAATANADKAYGYYYLAELDRTSGDPAAALASIKQGLQVDPAYPALLEGRARAEEALGQQSAALADFKQVVSEVPQPEYVVEYGDYLQSLGRTSEASTQYSLFETENKLFEANGVTLDTDPTLFYADHGDPVLALHYGQIGIRIRPFIEMDDAYGWALHVNHRDTEALSYAQKALSLGTRNALFYYHKGMIEQSLSDSVSARRDLAEALQIDPHFNPLAAPIAVSTLARLH